MHKTFSSAALAAALLSFAGFAGSAMAAAPDAGVYANYSDSDGTAVRFVVCGNQIGGCAGGGDLGPFKNACAVLEGTPKGKGSVVTRAIYVLDDGTASNTILYVYTRTDTFSDDNSIDNVQVSFKTQVPLNVVGGRKAHCSMVGDANFVYAGTDAAPAGSTAAVQVDKKTLTVTPIAQGVLKSLEVDRNGFVAVNANGESGIIGPDGFSQGSGGGDSNLVDDRHGWLLH